MSPRAACRLEQLGFTETYDYVGGKSDWLSFDLPYEGETVLVGSVLQRDVPTAERTERLVDARDRVAEAPAGILVVLADGVVNGVVRRRHLEGAGASMTVEDVMEVGVTTVRPAEDVEELEHRMGHANVRAITVTRSDGSLVGIFDTEQSSIAPPE